MGGNTKQKSRHQILTKQNELIDKLIGAWKHHIATKDPNQQLLSHEEVDESLGKLATSIAEVYDELKELEERVLFNAMPFYRRWWSRFYWWRQARKEKLVPPPATAEPPEQTEEEAVSVFGDLAEKARAAQKEFPKEEGEHNEETN